MKPRDAFKALKKIAKTYPGAWEDHPWGETVYKVGKKVFVFMGVDNGDGGFGMSVKLPDSSEAATTMFSWCEPTGYGLGKAGWVTAQLPRGARIDVELYKDWIDESYRAVAPRTLVRGLDAGSLGERR